MVWRNENFTSLKTLCSGSGNISFPAQHLEIMTKGWDRQREPGGGEPGEGEGASQLLSFGGCFLRGSDGTYVGAKDLKSCIIFMKVKER